MEEFKKPDEETIFNLGLATQQHIHNLFEKASECYIKNEPKTRAKCLINIKMMALSECDTDEKKELETQEKDLVNLLDQFDNLCRKGCIIYDPNNSRYLIVKNKNCFALFDTLEKKSNETEQFLRQKLSPMLFPKTGDKRFSLR